MFKKDVLKYFNNSVTSLANALDISVGAISQWPDLIPEKQALRLEKITGGDLEHDPKLYAAHKAKSHANVRDVSQDEL